jgi:hypothetical protein
LNRTSPTISNKPLSATITIHSKKIFLQHFNHSKTINDLYFRCTTYREGH